MTRLEDTVRQEVNRLASAEEALAQEYLRLVASGVPTWQAQKMAELELMRDVHRARAEYEIALSRLRLDR